MLRFLCAALCDLSRSFVVLHVRMFDLYCMFACLTWKQDLTIDKNDQMFVCAGLRLGWATGAPAVIQKLGHCVAGTSLGASSTSQVSLWRQASGSPDTVADDTSSMVVEALLCCSDFCCWKATT